MLVLINEKQKIKKMYLVFILLYRKGTEMWHQWCACVRARVFQNLVSFLVRHHFKATLCNSNPPKRPSFGQNLRQNHSNQFQWCAKYCKLQVQWLKKIIQDDNKCKINMCTSGHPVLQRHQASSSWVRRTGNWGHALIIWCICPGFFDSGSAEAAHKVLDQRYWVPLHGNSNCVP